MGSGEPWTATEADIRDYVDFVANRLQVLPDTEFNLFLTDGNCNPRNIPQLINLMDAMAQVESGHELDPPLSDWLEGLAAFQRDFPEAGK